MRLYRTVQLATQLASLLLSLTVSTSLAVAQSGNQPSLAALRAACSADAQKFCSGVQSGGGRVIACLKQNQDSLSASCRQAAGLPPKSVATPPQATPPPSTPPPSNSTQSTAPKSQPVTSAGDPIGKATNVAGEKFVRRAIPDPAHANMTAATIRLPEKWKLDSTVEWHYNWVEYPLTFAMHAQNPNNDEAWTQYPLQAMEAIEVAPQYRQYLRGKQTQPGERSATGPISMPVQQPLQALTSFIKKNRSNMSNLKWIGQQSLPTLAQSLKLDQWPNQQGIAIKISYDLNGKSVEEAFFAVYYVSQGGNESKSVGQLHMAANMIKQTNWGFQALQSFRAPAGTLDKRMPVFCLITKSVAPNPQWQTMAKSTAAQMTASFNQKLQQGYDQIRASQAIDAETQKQQAAFQANFDKQDAALRTTTFDDNWLRTSGGGASGGGGTRSSFDKGDDNIRGVDTMNDPSTGGTTQLSNAGQYHFTDGFGNYRTTDDPNYTPEKAGEVGSWTQMTPAQ